MSLNFVVCPLYCNTLLANLNARGFIRGDNFNEPTGNSTTRHSVTFGRNMQHTYYITVDHVEEPGVTNLTKDQVKEFISAIPSHKHVVVHNSQFELVVLKNSLGDI